MASNPSRPFDKLLSLFANGDDDDVFAKQVDIPQMFDPLPTEERFENIALTDTIQLTSPLQTPLQHSPLQTPKQSSTDVNAVSKFHQLSRISEMLQENEDEPGSKIHITSISSSSNSNSISTRASSDVRETDDYYYQSLKQGLTCKNEDSDRWVPTIPFMSYQSSSSSSSTKIYSPRNPSTVSGFNLYGNPQTNFTSQYDFSGSNGSSITNSSQRTDAENPAPSYAYFSSCTASYPSTTYSSLKTDAYEPSDFSAFTDESPSHDPNSNALPAGFVRSKPPAERTKLGRDDLMFSVIDSVLTSLRYASLDSQLTQILLEFFELFNPIFSEDLNKYVHISDDIQKGLRENSWDFTGTEVGGRGFQSPPVKKDIVNLFQQIILNNFES